MILTSGSPGSLYSYCADFGVWRGWDRGWLRRVPHSSARQHCFHGTDNRRNLENSSCMYFCLFQVFHRELLVVFSSFTTYLIAFINIIKVVMCQIYTYLIKKLKSHWNILHKQNFLNDSFTYEYCVICIIQFLILTSSIPPSYVKGVETNQVRVNQGQEKTLLKSPLIFTVRTPKTYSVH